MAQYKYINKHKNIKGDMKVTFESKVQQHGGSRLVSIPKTIRDVFGIDKGDVVLWEYDTDLKIITLKKQE